MGVTLSSVADAQFGRHASRGPRFWQLLHGCEDVENVFRRLGIGRNVCVCGGLRVADCPV